LLLFLFDFGGENGLHEEKRKEDGEEVGEEKVI
jgi:hypothetical protein